MNDPLPSSVPPGERFASATQLREALDGVLYFADPALATALYLGLVLGRPLLLEGEAGVGKTEVAKALATLLARPLVRLQCHEGLDVHNAIYEWDYGRQLLTLRLLESAGAIDRKQLQHQLFSRDLLLRRPLLEAVDPEGGVAPVLLIDELDRADEEFEAFLLELLSDFQVTIPEIGTIAARERPVVVLTSNRTREVHDALRRRCLYQWIDYPSADKEYRIVRARVPAASERLARQVVGFVQRLRDEGLYKPPGVAETIDWLAGLVALDHAALDAAAVVETLGLLVKYQDDVEKVRGATAERLLAAAPP